MSTGYSSRIWACPYFKWDERLIIHCEGGKVRLPDRDSYRDFVDGYCACITGWERCSLANAITEYYERTGEEAPE